MLSRRMSPEDDSVQNKDRSTMLSRNEKENEISEESKEDALRQQLQDELHPKRYCIHRLFILVSVISAGSAFFMSVGQFVGIALKSVGPIQYVLRVYVIMLCVLVMLNELEWPKWLTSDSTILNWWVTRGAVYSFIGILGLEENSTTSVNVDGSSSHDAALMYIKVVAWLMIASGILYFGMGVLCLQLVCNRQRENYQRRKERAKETRRATETYMSNSVTPNPV